MSNFKVGQKVVCIYFDNICVNTGLKAPHPKVNEMVVIEFIEDSYLTLKGYPKKYGYDPRNFRPLDHAFADEVEAMIKEQVKQDELQLI